MAINSEILVKGSPVVIRLHRFRNVEDAAYLVEGKTIFASDLLDVQLDRVPKHDISRFMPKLYIELRKEWTKKIDLYKEILKLDRKKLKKECKRKKDHVLKKLLNLIEKE